MAKFTVLREHIGDKEYKAGDTRTANPADVKELDRQFTINESIMRTKVIRPEMH